MDVLKGPYYQTCKSYLGFLGLWPLQNSKTKYFLRIINTLACFSTFIPHVAKAYELRHHFQYFLLCVPSLIYYIQFITKSCIMVAKEYQCKDLVERIRRDFQMYKGESLDILHQYAEQARKVNSIYVSYFFGAVILFNFSAFVPVLLDVFHPLNETRHRAVPRLMKYNIKKLENNFYVILVHGFVLDTVAMTLIMGFDTLLLNCSQHACALFQIVVVELKNAVNRKNNVDDSALENRDVFYEKIVKAIKMHKHAIEFVDLVESTYATANLLVIGITLGSITLAEFQTVQHKGQTEIMFRFAVFTSGELLHILFHNYPGQRIKDHSLKVYQSCYDCEWYREDISDESKKLLTLMMLRSQRPSFLTGGGLYVLGMENYATILKASLSYFTFLSSV